MSIQYKFFRMPTQPDEKDELELNQFLSSHKIQYVDRKFVNAGHHSFWGITVEYFSEKSDPTAVSKNEDSKSRPDYKKILTPDAFTLYLKLREWRKAVSEKEGIALYAVFTNDQLAKIAEKRISSAQGLQNLHGVGDSKVSKYSKAVIEIVNSYQKSLKTTDISEKKNETSIKSDI